MRKLIKTNEIKEIADIINERIDTLIEQANTLKNDIDSINNLYKGIDASSIITKYNETLKLLNSIIINYQEYRDYFYKITNSYTENINKATRNFNFLLEDNKFNYTLFSDINNVIDIDEVNL